MSFFQKTESSNNLEFALEATTKTGLNAILWFRTSSRQSTNTRPSSSWKRLVRDFVFLRWWVCGERWWPSISTCKPFEKKKCSKSLNFFLDAFVTKMSRQSFFFHHTLLPLLAPHQGWEHRFLSLFIPRTLTWSAGKLDLFSCSSHVLSSNSSMHSVLNDQPTERIPSPNRRQGNMVVCITRTHWLVRANQTLRFSSSISFRLSSVKLLLKCPNTPVNP